MLSLETFFRNNDGLVDTRQRFVWKVIGFLRPVSFTHT